MDIERLVIWNDGAGRAKDAIEIRDALSAESGSTVVNAEGSEDAERQVREFCKRGGRRVVVAGGDGTINAVINGLDLDAGIELGVLPVGTANDWCTSLAIPTDLTAAWEVLRAGVVAKVDLAEAHGAHQVRRFANIATGGNSQRVAEAVDDETKQRWGALSYVRTALPLLADLRTYNIAVSFDGGPAERFAAWNVVVANGRTSAGRVEVAPRAILNDGLVDVIIIEAGTAADIVDLSARYFFADYCSSERVVYRQARTVTIDSDPPVEFSMDGDLITEHPASFRALPEAIRAIVGPDFQQTPASSPLAENA